MWHWLTTSIPIALSPLGIAAIVGITWAAASGRRSLAAQVQYEIDRLDRRTDDMQKRVDRIEDSRGDPE